MPPEIAIGIGKLTGVVIGEDIVSLGEIILVGRSVLRDHVIVPHIVGIAKPHGAVRRIQSTLGFALRINNK